MTFEGGGRRTLGGTMGIEDAQGTPTQSYVSPIVLLYEDFPGYPRLTHPVAWRADSAKHERNVNGRNAV